MKDHTLNLIQKTNNFIKIYIKTTKDVEIEKQEWIRPKDFNNHNTNEPDIS